MSANRIIRISEIATKPGKAGMLPVSPATIWRWVRAGKFPPPFKIGSITAWYAVDIENFVHVCASRS